MNAPVTNSIYVTSIEEIIWGATLVAVTMVVHGFSMLLVLRISGALKQKSEPNESFTWGMSILILASWMILLVHLVEVFAWAGFFEWQDAVSVADGKANSSLCYYFALMDYTTLGCSYNLRERWRLLEGMIAMAGLLTFAWSTGVLLTLAQDFQNKQLLILKQRREKRLHKPAAAPPSGKPASPRVETPLKRNEIAGAATEERPAERSSHPG
jgi:hypothetical protein